MVDAETGQRGYLLTQHDEFLDPYTHAVENLPGLCQRIEQTILDPTARTLFTALRQAIDRRMEFSANVIAMQKRGEHDGPVALVTSGQGRLLMNEVRTRVDALDARQDHLMEVRAAEHRKSVQMNEILSWSLAALDLCFIGIMAFMLHRFQRAQALLRVCAWSQTVEYEGQWLTYEEYLRRRFNISVTHGISPEQAEKFLSKKRPQTVDRQP